MDCFVNFSRKFASLHLTIGHLDSITAMSVSSVSVTYIGHYISTLYITYIRHYISALFNLSFMFIHCHKG